MVPVFGKNMTISEWPQICLIIDSCEFFAIIFLLLKNGPRVFLFIIIFTNLVNGAIKYPEPIFSQKIIKGCICIIQIHLVTKFAGILRWSYFL